VPYRAILKDHPHQGKPGDSGTLSGRSFFFPSFEFLAGRQEIRTKNCGRKSAFVFSTRGFGIFHKQHLSVLMIEVSCEKVFQGDK